MKQHGGWLNPHVAGLKWRLSLSAVLGILTAACSVALLFTSGYLISKSALRPENILMVYVPIVGVRAFGLGRAALRYAERLSSHDAILRMLAGMRVRLYRVLEPQALQLRSRFRAGTLLGSLADDVEHLQDVYLRTVLPCITALFMYGGAVAFLGWFDLYFAVFMGLYTLLLAGGLPWWSLKRTRDTRIAHQAQRSSLYNTLTDGMLGLTDWVISGRSKELVERCETDERAAMELERKLADWASVRTFLLQLGIAGLILMLLIWSGLRTADGHLTVTFIAAFVLMVLPLSEAFIPLPEAVDRIPEYKESLRRLNNLDSAKKKTLHETKDTLVNDDTALFQPIHGHELMSASKQASEQNEVQGAIQQAVSMESPPLAGVLAVSLEHVTCGYEGEDAILKDISLQLEEGSRIAILGRSGAGKSTLLKVILGAISLQGGQASLYGSPAAQVGRPEMGRVDVLQQKPYLFDTTIANNIRLGRPDATDEELAAVIQQVRLGPLLDTLPLGLDTPMLEAGQRFSGGERQRIALARILLRQAPVVLLDEPTTGLDPRTERALTETLLDTLQGRTVIWVTHHLGAAAAMDQVVFLEEGSIMLQGSHQELLKHSHRYQALYELDHPYRDRRRRLSGAQSTEEPEAIKASVERNESGEHADLTNEQLRQPGFRQPV